MPSQAVGDDALWGASPTAESIPLFTPIRCPTFGVHLHLSENRSSPSKTYDPATDTITIDPIRAEAFESSVAHDSDVFTNGRTDDAIPAEAVTDSTRLRQLSAFFFWTSWTASTNRPDDHITFTNNWPYEPLVGNRATGEAVVWTGVSIIMLPDVQLSIRRSLSSNPSSTLGQSRARLGGFWERLHRLLTRHDRCLQTVFAGQAFELLMSVPTVTFCVSLNPPKLSRLETSVF